MLRFPRLLGRWLRRMWRGFLSFGTTDMPPASCCVKGAVGLSRTHGVLSSVPGLYSRANPPYREQLSPDIAKHPPGVGGQNCPSLNAVDLEIDSEVSLSSWAAIKKSHRLCGSNSRQQTFVSQTGRWNVRDQDTAH